MYVCYVLLAMNDELLIGANLFVSDDVVVFINYMYAAVCCP